MFYSNFFAEEVFSRALRNETERKYKGIDLQHGQRLGQSVQTRWRPVEGSRRDSGIDKRRETYYTDPWTDCPAVARMRHRHQQRTEHRRARLDESTRERVA